MTVYNLKHGNRNCAFTIFTEVTSFLWNCVFVGSCKCFGTLFGQFLLARSFHCIHRLDFFCCCCSSSSVVFIPLFIFLRLSRIDSNKTVQSWSINTCKIPLKYKNTNKLERSDADTVCIWKKGVHTKLVMKSETSKLTSKRNQTKSEKSSVNYWSKRSYKNKSEWSSFIS